MIEKEWLACEAPHQMLFFLDSDMGKSKVGRRKIRLLLSACCRQAWHCFVEPLSQRLIEASESYADGQMSYRNFRELWDRVFRAPARGAHGAHLACMATHYQIWAAAKDGWPRTLAGELVLQVSEKTHLIRDVFGNPFRSITIASKWRTDTVVALAAQMYESREFSAMPILADALQDAACDSDDILTHCRDANQPHVRGCWVVDLVLGKE